MSGVPPMPFTITATSEPEKSTESPRILSSIWSTMALAGSTFLRSVPGSPWMPMPSSISSSAIWKMGSPLSGGVQLVNAIPMERTFPLTLSASSIPRSISSTTLSGALMSFFIFFLSGVSLGQRRLDGFLRPVAGPGERFLPPGVEPLALLLAHLGLVATPQAPAALELLLVLPEPGGEPGQVRGAQGRCLERLGHLDGDAEDVGLELHHPAVGRGPAVGAEGRDVGPRVLPHRLDGVPCLVAHALERRPRQVRPRRAAREAHDGPARVGVPMRGAQPDERRHEVDVVVGVEAPGELFCLCGVLDYAEAVAEPLHSGAGDKDGAFEGVLDGLVAEAPGDGGEEGVLAHDGLGTGVHEGEGAGAVGVLGEALVEGHLAEEGRLLVAGHARYRDLGPEDGGVGVAVDVGAGLDLGKGGLGDAAQHLQKVVVPLQVEDVVHKGPRGVRVVGHVLLAARELVDQPRVDGAEADLAVLGPLLDAVDVLEQPVDLGAREVRVDGEAGLLPDRVVVALLGELAAKGRAPPVLPDDGVVDRLAGLAVPHYHRLALVGDPDPRDRLRRVAGVFQRPAHYPEGHVPDLVRVVLDPPGPRVVLGELLLRLADRRRIVVKDYGSARSGPLVDGQYVFPCHSRTLSSPATLIPRPVATRPSPPSTTSSRREPRTGPHPRLLSGEPRGSVRGSLLSLCLRNYKIVLETLQLSRNRVKPASRGGGGSWRPRRPRP